MTIIKLKGSHYTFYHQIRTMVTSKLTALVRRDSTQAGAGLGLVAGRVEVAGEDVGCIEFRHGNV